MNTSYTNTDTSINDTDCYYGGIDYYISYTSTTYDLNDMVMYLDANVNTPLSYLNRILKLCKWYIIFIFTCYRIRAPCCNIIKQNKIFLGVENE